MVQHAHILTSSNPEPVVIRDPMTVYLVVEISQGLHYVLMSSVQQGRVSCTIDYTWRIS